MLQSFCGFIMKLLPRFFAAILGHNLHQDAGAHHTMNPPAELDNGIREKARYFYGYGRWDAPYWFIGPEEGGSDDPAPRVAAWYRLQKPELCDCRKFHALIGITEHHQDKPPLVFTWRKLMLLLKAFQGEPCNLANGRKKLNDSLRNYQRDRWGMLRGETCVIELSGIPAPDSSKARKLQSSLFSKEEFEQIRQKRIVSVRQKLSDEKPPALLVMYGKSHWNYFECIAGCSLPKESIDGFETGILKCGNKKIALAQHPNFARRDSYWVELGKKLRQMS